MGELRKNITQGGVEEKYNTGQWENCGIWIEDGRLHREQLCCVEPLVWNGNSVSEEPVLEDKIFSVPV